VFQVPTEPATCLRFRTPDVTSGLTMAVSRHAVTAHLQAAALTASNALIESTLLTALQKKC
jgi:hypothetical protein